jgi:hypothetical protein
MLKDSRSPIKSSGDGQDVSRWFGFRNVFLVAQRNTSKPEKVEGLSYPFVVKHLESRDGATFASIGDRQPVHHHQRPRW